MKIKIDTAVATQITQAMMSGSEPVPRHCHWSCNMVFGVAMDNPTITFWPWNIRDRRKLNVGDWVINSPLGSNVLTDEEFKSFNLTEV